MIKITLDSSTAQRQLQDIAGQLRPPDYYSVCWVKP